MSCDDATEFGNLKQMMFPIDFGGLSFYFTEKLPVIEHYKNNIRKQVSVLYTGLISSPGSITFEPNVHIEGFVVAFLPHGFSDLFQFDVSVTTDQLPDFYILFEKDGKLLHQQLRAAKCFEAMTDVMNDYFLPKVPKPDKSLQILDAVTKIIESKGLVDVKKLAYEVNMSWKTLERHFRTRIGVSPKMYARFKRFHHALSLLNEPSPNSWLETAHLWGNYNHSELIKEFQLFTNQNLSAFPFMIIPCSTDL